MPAKEARVLGGTRVCVISWVVRSKTQSPSLDAERKKNMEAAASGRFVSGDVRTVAILAIMLPDMPSMAKWLRCHTRKATGICDCHLSANAFVALRSVLPN